MNKNILFIDFETTYSTKEKYSLRTMDIVRYVRDPRFKVFGVGIANLDMKPAWVSGEDIQATFAKTDWSKMCVVGHNIKFDGFILREKYGIVAGQYIDTMAMSQAVFGKTIKSHSAEFLAEHFGLEAKGHLNTDGKQQLTSVEEKELADYCIHDVDLCRAFFNHMSPSFPASQYASLDQTVRMFVNPRLKLNVDVLEVAAQNEAARRENIFKEIGIEKKVFASNDKFPALLRDKGYDVPMKESPRKKDINGNPVMIPALALGDTDFLDMLEGENDELRNLCEARVAAKSTLLETRSRKLADIGRTGCWPFDVRFSGADQTHRFSGGPGAGGNPQNFTRGSDLRRAVEAPDGYDLVVGDFSNIELRIQAYLSRDPGMIDAIESGRDIYCDFASVFYGRTITKDDKEERRFGKTAILGLGYGMGWRKFIRTVRLQTGQTIDEEASRRAVELYRIRYGQIPALWQGFDRLIEHLVTDTDMQLVSVPVRFTREALVLPSGLKIRFPNLRQEPGEHDRLEWVYDVWVKRKLEKRKLYGGKVLENICQGLAGELCKEAMVQMGDSVVGQVHDELLVLCKRSLTPTISAKLKRIMSVSPAWLPDMRLGAEVGASKNWLGAK